MQLEEFAGDGSEEKSREGAFSHYINHLDLYNRASAGVLPVVRVATAGGGNMTLRLLLADDHEVVRAGFREMLEGTGIQLVAEAKSGTEAIELAPQVEWDVALIDLAMPDLNGLAVVSQLRMSRPSAAVLLFAESEYPRLVTRATAAGAVGVLVKAATRAQIIEALEEAAAAKPIRVKKPGAPGSGIIIETEICLTDRELEVLRQLATGPTNKQIAQNLNISYETVKEHVQHLLQKIGVADRTQAAVWAVRHNIIELVETETPSS